MSLYNDRRPRPEQDGDDRIPLSKATLQEANSRIMDCVPDHKRDETWTKIRTTAVQRHRARQRGEGDFNSISEYEQFIYGTDE